MVVQAILEFIADIGLLQWGPTRGPGWSSGSPTGEAEADRKLQWGPTRGPG